MQNVEKTLLITKLKDCPVYQKGDRFRLAQYTLSPPANKPVCLILAGDLIQFQKALKSTDDQTHTLNCGGCGGSISLSFHASNLPEDVGPNERIIANISSILSKFSMFQSLGIDEIKDLVAYIRLSQYNTNETILQRGDAGKNLFILLSGRVEVLGKETVRIATLKKGDVFGEMSLLSGEPVGATVKALVPSKVLYFHSHDFRKVLHHYPSLQMYLAKLLTKRLALTNLSHSREIASGLQGTLTDTPPSELCQTINMNQKTGILTFQSLGADAAIHFRNGAIIKASYGPKSDKDAFFEILKKSDGSFHFQPGLPGELNDKPEIGHFMCLLMEGVSRMDEEKHQTETQT